MGQDQVESKRKYAYMAAPALVALGAALGFGVAPDPITFENISERSGINWPDLKVIDNLSAFWGFAPDRNHGRGSRAVRL